MHRVILKKKPCSLAVKLFSEPTSQKLLAVSVITDSQISNPNKETISILPNSRPETPVDGKFDEKKLPLILNVENFENRRKSHRNHFIKSSS